MILKKLTIKKGETRKFNLKDKMDNLPLGYDSLIYDKSSNFSGGEKQKLAIIKALLNNGDLIILDEPSSAMKLNQMS